MDSKSNYFEDLKVIKKVMEESSRFLSLSGLSGIFAGIIALIGAAIAILGFMNGGILFVDGYTTGMSSHDIAVLKSEFFIDAILVLIFALAFSFFFSIRKSASKGLKMWTPVSRRLLINLMIPLFTGGILIPILYFQDQWQFIIPLMLIFYGLALVNAGKFTYNEVFYLGLSEIITGLVSAVFPVYGLFFWCFGFGLLHIAYGLIMYRKYEI